MVAVLRCENCGRAHGATVEEHRVCRCGQSLLVTPQEAPKSTGFPLDKLAQEREAICLTCEHQKNGFCQLLAKRGKVGRIHCTRGIHNKKAKCPDGRWGEVSSLCKAWGKDRDVFDAPNGSVVVTAADKKYIRGAYFMIWTLFRSNRIPVRLFLDGVSENDPHVEQMRSWGVETTAIPQRVHRRVPWSQTWNKPFCILEGLADFNQVAWLDSDTSVAASLEGMFRWITEQPFAPNHGTFSADQANDPEIHEFLGEPFRTWDVSEYPCAGVLGFQSGRDEELIKEWGQRCVKVTKRPKLWRHGVKSPLRFFDQGVLQDLWRWDTADGRRWNNFQVRRRGSVSTLMRQTFNYPDHTICHYGGPVKPWTSWPAVLNWGDPRR